MYIHKLGRCSTNSPWIPQILGMFHNKFDTGLRENATVIFVKKEQTYCRNLRLKAVGLMQNSIGQTIIKNIWLIIVNFAKLWNYD